MISNTHALTRTSPKGEKFIGKCIQCGKEGLTIGQGMQPTCENVIGLSHEDALLAVLSGIEGESQ